MKSQWDGASGPLIGCHSISFITNNQFRETAIKTIPLCIALKVFLDQAEFGGELYSNSLCSAKAASASAEFCWRTTWEDNITQGMKLGTDTMHCIRVEV